MVRLKIENLSFSYGKRKVLENIELEVAEGEILCLVGPNGAGKSTLLKCIAGIIRPNSGRILLGEADLTRASLKRLSKIIGYVPQSVRPSVSTTVFEAILTSRLPYIGWSPSIIDLEKTEDIIKRLGLEELAFRYINEVSGGELQRVLLAMALVKEPKVLLLDEPTSNLDLKHQIEILRLVRDLRCRGLIIIMATHDLTSAYRVSDKILMLKSGRVFATGKPEDVLTAKNISEVYGVEPFISPEHRSIVPAPLV